MNRVSSWLSLFIAQAVRAEDSKRFNIFLIIGFITPLYGIVIIAHFASHSTDDASPFVKVLVLILLQIANRAVLLYFGLRCARNFHKGLKQRMFERREGTVYEQAEKAKIENAQFSQALPSSPDGKKPPIVQMKEMREVNNGGSAHSLSEEEHSGDILKASELPDDPAPIASGSKSSLGDGVGALSVPNGAASRGNSLVYDDRV